MVQDFSHATIRELIIALDEVERSMLEGRPLTIDPMAGTQAPDRRRAYLTESEQVTEPEQLTEIEQRISRELAVRRADMHTRWTVAEVVR